MTKTHIFTTLTIGSYEVSATIYEVEANGTMRLLNKIKQKVEIGKDILESGVISYEKLKKLCQELNKMKSILAEYPVEDVLVYGATAIRQAGNQDFVLEMIKKETGFDVKVVNNPQQSFLVYKGVISSPKFYEVVKGGAAILDASAGMLRVSIYQNGSLVLTQNAPLGSMQIREWLRTTGYSKSDQSAVIREMLVYRFRELDSLFLEDLKIDTLILAGDLFTGRSGWRSKKGDLLKEDDFLRLCKKAEKALEKNSALTEEADILLPSVIICEEFFKRIEAKQVWISGVDMNEGIAYDYVYQKKYKKSIHNFEEDIYQDVIQTMNRYVGDPHHNYYVEKICTTIFKSLQKPFHLSEREKLLLRIAALLHNCGSYISMESSLRCSSYIVKRTEIVGLSNREKRAISEAIRYHKMSYPQFLESVKNQGFSRKEINVIARMAVILGIANTIDAAHKQKFDSIKATIHAEEFRITVNSLENGILEKQFMQKYQEFFEILFGYRLILREKNQRFRTI